MYDFALAGLDTKPLSEEGLPVYLHSATGLIPLPPRRAAPVEHAPEEPVEGDAEHPSRRKRRSTGLMVPTETPEPVAQPTEWAQIWTLGPDATLFRQVQHEQAVARSRKIANGQEYTFEDREEDIAQMLARISTRWNLRTREGDDIPFSVEAALAFYRQYPWGRDQVDRASTDRARFSKAS